MAKGKKGQSSGVVLSAEQQARREVAKVKRESVRGTLTIGGFDATNIDIEVYSERNTDNGDFTAKVEGIYLPQEACEWLLALCERYAMQGEQ